jgi:guanylate kinase
MPNTIDTKYVLHILRKMKKKLDTNSFTIVDSIPKKQKLSNDVIKIKEDEDDYIIRRCFKLSKEVKKFDKLIMSITNNNSIYLQRF